MIPNTLVVQMQNEEFDWILVQKFERQFSEIPRGCSGVWPFRKTIPEKVVFLEKPREFLDRVVAAAKAITEGKIRVVEPQVEFNDGLVEDVLVWAEDKFFL